MIAHVINHVIGCGWYQKDIQTNFLKELITILRKGQLHTKIIDIKLKKLKTFSLGQNVGFVCK